MPRRKPGLSPHPLSAMRVEQAYSDMSLLLNKRLTALYALPLALSTDAQTPTSASAGLLVLPDLFSRACAGLFSLPPSHPRSTARYSGP